MVPFCCDRRQGPAQSHIRAKGTSQMKKLTLLTAAALSCCALSSTFAQVQILRSGARASAPRLVSEQTERDDLEPFAGATEDSQESVAKEAIPNPFDYFSEDLPTVQPKSAVSENSSDRLTEEHSLLEDGLPTTSLAPKSNDSKPSSLAQESDADDEASTPVGRHHRRKPSVVDTIVNQATLGNVPNCATTPVYWGGAQHTPNPVAEWLLREQCVEGLWASYPQLRAAECAQMWNCLAGHSAHGCGSGCGDVSGLCSVCAQSHARHNRYTGRFSTPPMGCDPCNSCQIGAAPCSSCGGGDSFGPAAPGCADCAQTAARFALGQLVKTDKGNVTQLPSLQIYR